MVKQMSNAKRKIKYRQRLSDDKREQTKKADSERKD